MRSDFAFRYANFMSSGAHLVLLLVGARIGTRGGWVMTLSAIGLISLLAWIANFRRSRAVADTPTSRVASAPQGYVELFGTAKLHPGFKLQSPVSMRPCVWYRYCIEEKQGKDWRQIGAGISSDTFLLHDATGEAIIDPDNAEIYTTDRRTWYEGNRRYSEWLLVPQGPLYAIGEFATRGGAATAFDPQHDLDVLLREWKTDKLELLRKFDLDRNGEIDMKEWQLARQAARREVAKQHRQIRAQPGVHIVHKPADDRLFLLANLNPDRVARRYGFWTLFQLVTAIAAGAALLFLLTSLTLR